MASSSKTKRPRTSGSKQGGSTSKSNPLNLTRLLANDDQRKVFEEYFHGKFPLQNTVISETLSLKTVYFLTYCINKNFLIFDVKRTIFIPSLNNFLNSHVKGKDIRKQQGYGETVKNSDILSTGYLKLEERLLHYFLSYVIFPKLSNHSQISDIELQLIKCGMFAAHYKDSWGLQLALNIRESKIDIEVVHKMGFTLDPVTRRTYRHRTDRPTAPTEQPEPTIPDQPEFHAPSSSSAAKPSN
ncbi:hypothetical protein Lal_00043666 [Lupinus albus]|nr:hypothetical protein Lal_00043666 [Lupinus albus]